jgi:hypothetical protein
MRAEPFNAWTIDAPHKEYTKQTQHEHADQQAAKRTREIICLILCHPAFCSCLVRGRAFLPLTK